MGNNSPNLLYHTTFYHKFNFSKSTIGLIVAVLAYIISPIDIVPDFIPLAGLLDDAALLTMVLNSIKNDIERYKNNKK